MLTLSGLFSILPFKSDFLCKMKAVVRMNVYYFMAMINVFFNSPLFRHKTSADHKITLPGLGRIEPE
jgi:hypothetical protein